VFFARLYHLTQDERDEVVRYLDATIQELGPTEETPPAALPEKPRKGRRKPGKGEGSSDA
jgi:hypothetical protein